MRRTTAAVIAIMSIILLSSVPAGADWPQNGVRASLTPFLQTEPLCVSDEAGGVIIVVSEENTYGSGYDIYAFRIGSDGTVLWGSLGVEVCVYFGEQIDPRIVPDGAGGAVITWADTRDGGWDVYAQRIDASGTALWASNGVLVCNVSGMQYYPDIAHTGSGEWIITWMDDRDGNQDIYANRLDASGAPQWGPGGAAVCADAADQILPEIVTNGTGGAIISWIDYRWGNYDIYAQNMYWDGTDAWAKDGLSICLMTNNQEGHVMISDGSNGAIIAWEDMRNGSDFNIYAQKINSTGSHQWDDNGSRFCSAAGDQRYIDMISDGAGGAIITWQDSRNPDYDIFAQKIHSTGAPAWTYNGIAVCDETASQNNPALTSDGDGGAVLTWHDFRNGSDPDIYAQRVTSAGIARWRSGGVPVSTAAYTQKDAAISGDGDGGVIIVWKDERSGNHVAYAERVREDGLMEYLLPVIDVATDVPGDQGGSVSLGWHSSTLDYLDGVITEYTVWRALDGGVAMAMADGGATVISSPSELFGNDTEADPGDAREAGGRVLLRGTLAGQSMLWELVSTHAAYFLEGYSAAVPTLFDSTAACDDFHYFQVIAHTSEPMIFYTSDPDSGYSVDNLAPAMPLALAGEQMFGPDGLQLTWDPNTEPDLAGYHIYRGISSGFEPGPGSFVASTPDTATFDGDWDWAAGYWYKVAAVDIHGNESVFAVLDPDMLTGDDPMPAPDATFLAQNYPNPFNPSTTIRFGLKERGEVSLRIYDAAGRLVRVLADGSMDAGSYELSWNGLDGSGASVASGVYFYMLKAEEFEETKKMVLLR